MVIESEYGIWRIILDITGCWVHFLCLILTLFSHFLILIFLSSYSIVQRSAKCYYRESCITYNHFISYANKRWSKTISTMALDVGCCAPPFFTRFYSERIRSAKVKRDQRYASKNMHNFIAYRIYECRLL